MKISPRTLEDQAKIEGGWKGSRSYKQIAFLGIIDKDVLGGFNPATGQYRVFIWSKVRGSCGLRCGRHPWSLSWSLVTTDGPFISPDMVGEANL
ncbi:hypothetical protein PGT21_031451 [Puccinia graminis f. sp. tritici]|uniref:Uncharacterized protein n=1 Tax=Puccinia graminis f. sp. tritici TaxID=56615 RepID=A0A5B0NR13_PUCGR|nr:hypothetical protein PGTUg99_032154 [Puccinia graminis f. sp. tritici]KAA1091333.1 hypothetical protein PGT21_031451 [Puccinia graminis f. sp. tritici]